MNFFIFSTLLYLFKSNNKKVVIDFDTELNTNISIENFMQSFFYNKIFTYLSIGTPFQKIPVSIKFRNYPFYIIDSSSKFLPSKNQTFYNKNISSTFKQYNSNFSGLYEEDIIFAYLSEDDIKINDKYFFKKMKFNLASEFKNNSIYFSGCIGLNLFSNDYFFVQSHFITQLKQNSFIKSYDFTINYLDDNKGKIIIGLRPDEYDNNYNENDIKYININYIEFSDFYYVIFSNILMNVYNIENYVNIYFQIEFNFILGSYKFYNYIQSNFFNKFIENKICFLKQFIINYNNKEKKYDYFLCNDDINLKEFGNLIFYIKEINFNFTLNENDLFINYKNKKFFLIVFEKGSNEWILGKPFFKKYQLVFNQDKKIIYFYNKKRKQNHLKIKIFHIIFFLLLLILICLLFYIIIFKFKKQKRIKVKELEENLNYLNFDDNKLIKKSNKIEMSNNNK